MPNTAILSHLGFAIRPAFLSREACRQIRAEMAAAARVPAMVRPAGESGGVVDRLTRRTGIASVAPSTVALVESRLRNEQPVLEKHFHIGLSGWQRPRFYVYEEGDFFTPHRDSDAEDPAAPDWIKARQVSVSVFLNDGRNRGASETYPSEAYQGGSMVFHGRRGDGQGGGFALSLESEEGMLVAFRSDWIHEIKPVTSGRRYSIVTWFY